MKFKKLNSKTTANIEDTIKDTPENNDKKQSKLLIESSQSFSPIRDIFNGIIVTKNREFIKILEVSPINFMLRSVAERNSIIQSFAMAIRTMPVELQFKVISHKADVASYISKIDAEIETEENHNCRVLQNEQKNLIRHVSSRGGVTRRFFIIFKYSDSSGFKKSPSLEEISYELQTSAVRIQNMLSQCGNEVTIYNDDDEIMSILHTIMCRKESETQGFEKRLIDTVARYLATDFDDDNYVPVNEFICPSRIDTKTSPKYIIVDGVYYSFAYLPSNAYPTAVPGGWLSLLINMGEGIDIDFFVKKERSEVIQTKLQYALRFNKMQARSTEDTSMDYDELVGTLQSGYHLKQGLANGDEFCYMMTLLTISGNSLDELEWKIKEVKNYLIAHDFRMKQALFQQEECFLMSLPICYMNSNIFAKAKRNCLSSSLASAYPFVAFEVADPNGILWGINKANNSLVFVDNFDTKTYKNANMAILGTSGSGKTFSLQCMALRMRQKKIQVFIIAPSKGHEFKRACKAIGGEYIKISAGSEQTINIMEIRKRDINNTELLDGVSNDSILSKKIQQLHTFFSLLIPDISHEEKQIIDEALVETYRRFGITNNNDSLFREDGSDLYKQMPILGDLHQVLSEFGEDGKRMHTILARYVTGSASSFNKHTNVNLDNKYIVLDVSELTQELLPVGMFIVLDYVWDKVREDRTARKAVFLDELWELIGAKSSVQAAEFVLEIFKVIRGYGGSAIAATQDINDFFALEDGRFGKGIINNAKTKFVLQLEKEEVQRVQEVLGLSDTEALNIMQFGRGEGLLAANSNHVLVGFKASETETRLITTDRKILSNIAESNRMN